MDGGNIGCYYVAKTASSMSYFGAQKYCKSLDRRAHLVEVRSKDIQTFIESLKDFHYFFLGGSDRSKVCIPSLMISDKIIIIQIIVFQVGHWVWESSGVPFTYTNWRSGEPNNSGGNEDCVYIDMGSKGWNDYNCASSWDTKPLCQILM